MATLLITSTAFFPPIRWYILAVRYGHWQVEAAENYQKGGYRNRCLIATANGPLYLSIPLEKGKHQATPVREVRMSQRSNWPRALQQSIQSAYGRSPFYEFYAPELLALLSPKTLLLHAVPYGREPTDSERHNAPFLWDLNWRIFAFIHQALQLDFSMSCTLSYRREVAASVLDLRDKHAQCPVEPLPYPQLFSDRFGFNPEVSILDLLFCMGPEANSYLRRCAAQ